MLERSREAYVGFLVVKCLTGVFFSMFKTLLSAVFPFVFNVERVGSEFILAPGGEVS